jgi:hypothetical protein
MHFRLLWIGAHDILCNAGQMLGRRFSLWIAESGRGLSTLKILDFRPTMALNRQMQEALLALNRL